MNAIPSIFEIPAEVRSALPGDVQKWLINVESRIDGMVLPKIEKEAKKLAGPTEDWKKIYRLGRRLFYARIQEIFDIMHPNSGLEVGIDLIFRPYGTDIPGAAVDHILFGEEPSNGSELEEAGILDDCGQPADDLSEREEAAV